MRLSPEQLKTRYSIKCHESYMERLVPVQNKIPSSRFLYFGVLLEGILSKRVDNYFQKLQTHLIDYKRGDICLDDSGYQKSGKHKEYKCCDQAKQCPIINHDQCRQGNDRNESYCNSGKISASIVNEKTIPGVDGG